MDKSKFALPERFAGGARNIWIDFQDLVREYNPLNLGEGAPDFAAPELLKTALAEAATSNDYKLHQYARGFGHPRLVNALCKLYSPLIRHEINAQNEIIITNGATGALYYSIIGLVNDGDEVIIIEPYFDSYESLVLMAGGKPVFVQLRSKDQDVCSSSDLILDTSELEAAFNRKTKMIIVNSPHNPSGKVFTQAELALIADLCIRWDVVCVYDEVYEWMVHEPYTHVRIASFPGMWERTLTVGSAGKSFTATGWKIGWAYGPSHLIHNLQVMHQNCVYSCCTPAQEAFARCYERELETQGTDASYFTSLARSLQAKRDFTATFLREAGLSPVVPDGGYFMLADWRKFGANVNISDENIGCADYRFTVWMVRNLGLQVIPYSSFYSNEHKSLGHKYVRICFVKEDANLERAADILKGFAIKNNKV